MLKYGCRVAVALTCAATMTASLGGAPAIGWADGDTGIVVPNTPAKNCFEASIDATLTSQYISQMPDELGAFREGIGHVTIDLNEIAGATPRSSSWWSKFLIEDPMGNSFTPDASGLVNFDVTLESFSYEIEDAPPVVTKGGENRDGNTVVDIYSFVILWPAGVQPIQDIWYTEGKLGMEPNYEAIENAGGRVIDNWYQQEFWRTLMLASDSNSYMYSQFRQSLQDQGFNPDDISAAYFDMDVYEALLAEQQPQQPIVSDPDSGTLRSPSPSKGPDNGGDSGTDDQRGWHLYFGDPTTSTPMSLFPAGGLSHNMTTGNDGHSTYSYTLRGNPVVPEEFMNPQQQPSSGEQTGSGVTELYMQTAPTGEYGGTAEPIVIPAPEGTPENEMVNQDGKPEFDGGYVYNPEYNPDGEDEDSLGDNIAFTVPTAINYVANANGSLIGPTNAYIENHSVFGIHVNSMKATEEDGWHFVQDATASGRSNSVDLQIGVPEEMLQVSEHVNEKKAVNAPHAWKMGTVEMDDAMMYEHVSDVIAKHGFDNWSRMTNLDDFYETDTGYIYLDQEYIPVPFASSTIVATPSEDVPANIPQSYSIGGEDCSLILVSDGPLIGNKSTYQAMYSSPSQTTQAVIIYDASGNQLAMEAFHKDENNQLEPLNVEDWNIFYKKKSDLVSKKLFLSTTGDTSHVTQDLSTKQKFGELRWYVSGDAVSTFSPFTAVFYGDQTSENTAQTSDSNGESVSSGENRFAITSTMLTSGPKLLWAVVDGDSPAPAQMGLVTDADTGDIRVQCLLNTSDAYDMLTVASGYLSNDEWMIYHEEGDDGRMSWNEFFELTGLSAKQLAGKKLCLAMIGEPQVTTQQEI